jgi:hypothetical protein
VMQGGRSTDQLQQLRPAEHRSKSMKMGTETALRHIVWTFIAQYVLLVSTRGCIHA